MPWLILILFGGAAYIIAKNASSSGPARGDALVPAGATGDTGKGSGVQGAGAASGRGKLGLASASGGDAALQALLTSLAGGATTPTKATGAEWYITAATVNKPTPAGQLALDELLKNYVPVKGTMKTLKKENEGADGYLTYAYDDRTLTDRSNALPVLARQTAAAGFTVLALKSDIDAIRDATRDTLSITSVKKSDLAAWVAAHPSTEIVILT